MKKIKVFLLSVILLSGLVGVGCKYFKPTPLPDETPETFKARQIAIYLAQTATWLDATSDVTVALNADSVISRDVAVKILTADNKVADVALSVQKELATGVITATTREKVKSLLRFVKDINVKGVIFKDPTAQMKVSLIIDQLDLVAQNLFDLVNGNTSKSFETRVQTNGHKVSREIKTWPAIVAAIISNAGLRASRQSALPTADAAYSDFLDIVNLLITKNNNFINSNG